MNITDPSHLSTLRETGKVAYEWLPRLFQKSIPTYEHSIRVGMMAEKIAVFLNFTMKETSQLVTGCLLHDFGKILVPDYILNKKERLTAQEWDMVKCHPKVGAEILEIPSNIDKETVEIIHYHHERWDGQGYPEGLRGEQIPKFARICAVLDAFDCMVTDRIYRQKISIGEAKLELINHSGTQFDKEVVTIFLEISNQISKMYEVTN